MAKNQIDLSSLFNTVTKTMQENKSSLNEADSYNHDHGDHMAEIFEVITQAMKEKKNADPADQLEYAAQILRKKSKSGSGQLYADGLGKAAQQILGKDLNLGTILAMLQTIMGAGQSSTKQQSSTGGGLLGSLLGGLVGGKQQDNGLDLGDLMGALTGGGSQEQDNGLDMGDLLGSLTGSGSGSQGGLDMGDLLGALTGGSGSQSGIDMGDLLGALTGSGSGTQGKSSGLDSLADAVLSGTKMEESDYRKQSGQLVTSTMLKALTSMLAK